MDINQITKEVHQNATEHGWWENPLTFGEIIALCHSELSEALEAYRNGEPILYCNNKIANYCPQECVVDPQCPFNACKPEGIAIELADCIIRILDYCGHAEIDIAEAIRLKHEYNKTRPYRHGGKVL